MSPQSEPDLVAGTFRAFRIWRIDTDGLSLKSMNQANIHWPRNQPLVAQCMSRHQKGDRLRAGYITCEPIFHGDVPDPNCTCGIYAKYDPTDLGEYVGHTGINVFGCIECSGTIQHGTDGLRAEKARVVALVPLDTLDYKVVPGTDYYKNGIRSVHQAAQLVANAYNVPLFATMKQLLREYPMEDVSGLQKATPVTPPPPCNRADCPICSPGTIQIVPGPGSNQSILYSNGRQQIITEYDPRTGLTSITEYEPSTNSYKRYVMSPGLLPGTMTFNANWPITTTSTNVPSSTLSWEQFKKFMKNLGA